MTNSNPGLFGTQPAVNSSGTLTYTPATNQYGTATLNVTLTNSFTGLGVTHSFSLSVVGTPTAAPDYYVVNTSGGSSASSAQGVLANDTNPNSGMTMYANMVSGPAHGGLTLNSDGSLTYTPNGGFQGVDSFTYQDQVGPALGNTVTVTVYSHGGSLVAKMYQQMLGRAASSSDIGYWAPSVDSNPLNIASVDQGVYNSAEYENPKVTSWFNGFLGRGPSGSDLSYWEGQWVSYESPEQVIIAVASTQESFNYAQTQYHYGDQNENWVSLIYPVILNRSADSGALSYFTGQLDGNSMTRAQVVQALVYSNEYRDDVIQSFFQTLLMRSASQSDINYYQGLMANNGYTQLHIQQSIPSVAEYLNNPAAPSSGVAAPWIGPGTY
ncbi:MAG TPA: DUF4214 domain-containing protein [Pirellulales bacterium]|nr:DUF4214 domain-containing protein [Pirellulales bacterium]